MPNRASAKKSLRQNEKRRVENKAKKKEVKTLTKRVAEAVKAKDVHLAEQELKLAVSKLDKLAKRNIFHPNKVARKKSQLAKLVDSLGTSQD